MVTLIVMAVHLHLQLIWSSLGWIYIHLKYILAHKHTGQNGKHHLAGTWFIHRLADVSTLYQESVCNKSRERFRKGQHFPEFVR